MLSKIAGALKARFTSLPVWLTGLVCSATITLIDLRRGWEGTWFYTISTIMHQPEAAHSVYSRRILFPFLAVVLQRVFPSLSDHNCFIATQIGAILLAVYLSGEWASLFLPRVGKLAGYALVTLMLCPLFSYWNFYDIGVLWLLDRMPATASPRPSPRLPGASCHRHAQSRKHPVDRPLCPALQLGPDEEAQPLPVCRGASSRVVGDEAPCHISIIHSSGGFEVWFWKNLTFWRTYSPQGLFFAVVLLVPWWLLASTGWRYAHPGCCDAQPSFSPP